MHEIPYMIQCHNYHYKAPCCIDTVASLHIHFQERLLFRVPFSFLLSPFSLLLHILLIQSEFNKVVIMFSKKITKKVCTGKPQMIQISFVVEAYIFSRCTAVG